MGPVRLADVEESHQGIVRAAKELEAEGTIVLGGKGKEDAGLLRPDPIDNFVLLSTHTLKHSYSRMI